MSRRARPRFHGRISTAVEREVTLNRKNTRSAKGSGTIRQRSDGRWEARYVAGIDPKTGNKIRKSIYGTSQKEVRQALTRKLCEVDEGFYMGIDVEITLEDSVIIQIAAEY